MSHKRILVVEDEKDLRDVYSLILQHFGYEVCTANNGKQALSEIESCQPDLVLLDIFMPEMDGESFMKHLDMEKYPNTKVIVCSNTADQKLMENMLKLGASDVVTKSRLAPTELGDLVASYL